MRSFASDFSEPLLFAFEVWQGTPVNGFAIRKGRYRRSSQPAPTGLSVLGQTRAPVVVASTKHASVSVRATVAWRLKNSFTNFEILRSLPDSPEYRNAKLDLRISEELIHSLKSATSRL